MIATRAGIETAVRLRRGKRQMSERERTWVYMDETISLQGFGVI